MLEFPTKKLVAAVSRGRFEWRSHALKRMIKRSIASADVLKTLNSGEVIEEYPDDFPLPAALFLGHTEGGVPLHVVASYDEGCDCAYIVTVYRPDSERFNAGGSERRKRSDE